MLIPHTDDSVRLSLFPYFFEQQMLFFGKQARHY